MIRTLRKALEYIQNYTRITIDYLSLFKKLRTI